MQVKKLLLILSAICISTILLTCSHTPSSLPVGIVEIVEEAIEDPYAGVLELNIMGFDGSGSGSCVIVDHRDGWWFAITAKHCTEGSFELWLGNYLYLAEVVEEHSQRDVALIKFYDPDKQYPIYKIAEARDREPCVTVGWSYGSRLHYIGNVVTTNFRGFVAANGGVFPGCSGGPLLNAENEIIGVTVQIAVYRGGVFDNTSLYVPSRFITDLLGE